MEKIIPRRRENNTDEIPTCELTLSHLHTHTHTHTLKEEEVWLVVAVF